MWAAIIETHAGARTVQLGAHTKQSARERAEVLARREWTPESGDAFKVPVTLLKDGDVVEEFKVLIWHD